ncbi:MAG: glycerol-3-phosphate 1-O-acyltransferase PlsY [Candidatus Marinimicrobia bacterium]|jgi:glycerol-3-phosphate acyltransferase PlsY|nr:glycerol-3-phosphate 1-O-acyltransferase PlsY [Candidatus Neomarinimicrobiota bacterium]MBT5955907.1 glycerol-3-phosphate 1-O-acyltransferase PlsY [Candidatus Neomarinimicrobiota bacterium]MBT6871032.1 glycerol-3-phosphate 1-O-acyltransferase PlsY [Candidatus Neomarinimicrobiota bacterium]MBT7376989.1 glycerol-3-phosphate 1-O-acyltransferase PlsY [Candidatus Neomarinimicrobiota bacterium]|tara:strand:+ start:2941 stop:3570 length:630 start_codon:yes stop_codon:yes gene_type:complete
MGLEQILRIIISYLIGSISGSMLMGKIRGVDIRTMGSGNAGGTNAFRTQGAIFALSVVVVDIAKGYVATYYVSGDFGQGSMLGVLCGIVAVLGHVYPVYYNFKGGKGAGTLVGILIGLYPFGLLISFSVWLIILVLTGYVGLSTMLAGISFPFVIYYENFMGGLNSTIGSFSIIMALFLVFTHRSNIIRMLKGNENRFEKVMIFRKKSS